MDLILWRHAEAQDHSPALEDMARRLTRRGQQQAVRMAGWLQRHLPPETRILVSPARRTQQSAAALARPCKTHVALQPGASAEAVLQLVSWPMARVPVLVVGHQPTLGQVAACVLGMRESDCAIKKGAVWWLRYRVRDGVAQTLIRTVQLPELM